MDSIKITPFAAKFVFGVTREEPTSKFSYVPKDGKGFDVCKGTPAELRAAAAERDRYYRELSKSVPVSRAISPELNTISAYPRSSTSPTLFSRTVFSAINPLPKGGE